MMRKRIKNFLSPSKIFILTACGLGVLTHLFFFEFISDVRILFFTALWVLSVWLYEFKGRISIAGGLVFLIFCPFLLLINREPIAEKAAIWAYMFLVVGVVQEFIEYLGENRKK